MATKPNTWTTIRIPAAVVARLRQLSIAVAHESGSIPSLGQVITLGLDDLERGLRKRKVPIPAAPAASKSRKDDDAS